MHVIVLFIVRKNGTLVAQQQSCKDVHDGIVPYTIMLIQAWT